MFKSKFKKYSFLWITLILFLGSFMGSWYFSWITYVKTQQILGQPIEFSSYFSVTTKEILENWQSEFLQLMWQAAGLSFLYFVGSPQSKDGDLRREKKLDMILKKLDPKDAEREISNLERKYPLK